MDVGEQYRLYEYQVGGRTLMLRSADNRVVLKKILKKNEYNFYTYIQSTPTTHPHHSLTPYLPLCHKLHQKKLPINYSTEALSSLNPKISQWFDDIKQNKRNYNIREHQLFMEMENFCYRYGDKLNLMDVKVGTMPKKTHNWFCVKRNLKVTGVLKSYGEDIGKEKDMEGNEKKEGKRRVQFVSRVDLGGIIDQQKFLSLLAYFLSDATHNPNPKLLTTFIKTLQNLSLTFRTFHGYEFNSTSLCFLYNTDNPQLNQIRVIDFGRVKVKQMGEHYDQNLINGISHLIRYFQEILGNLGKYGHGGGGGGRRWDWGEGGEEKEEKEDKEEGQGEMDMEIGDGAVEQGTKQQAGNQVIIQK